MDDADAEIVLSALGSRLCWEWSLRKPVYIAQTQQARYTIEPPRKPTTPWWMLYITDVRLLEGCFFGALPPGDALFCDNIPCPHLAQAKAVSEYHVANNSLPEKKNLSAAALRSQHDYDAWARKNWLRFHRELNSTNKRRWHRRPKRKRRL